MTQEKDKDHADSNSQRSSALETNNNTDPRVDHEGHEYDPGGMAGKKAGIVEELKHKARESESKGTKAKAPNDNDENRPDRK